MDKGLELVAVLALLGILGFLARQAIMHVDDAPKQSEPIDCGGGLFRLPDPELQPSYSDWARDTWEQWVAGRSHFSSGPDGPTLCPACYYVGLAEQSNYLAANHHSAEAATRWRNSVNIERAEAKALGECRCDLRVTPGEAAARSANELRRYGNFRG